MAANFWASSHCNEWLLTKAQLTETNKKDRMYLIEEELKRVEIYHIHVMEVLGKQLKLHQKVIATAIVYFKRFFVRNNFVDHDPRLVIPTCLYLAAKVEECAMQATKPEDWQTQVQVYVTGMENIDPTITFKYSDILDFEFTLLEELDFYLVIFHVYRPLTQFLEDPQLDADLIETAWHVANDSYRTNLCLIYPPYVTALACVLVSSFLVGRDLRQWFSDMNVDMKDVWDATQDLLDMYDIWKKVSALQLQALLKRVYSKIPQRNHSRKK